MDKLPTSVPPNVQVTISFALTLPKAVSPSSILDSTELVVITGAVSSTSVIVTVISCESDKVVSLAVTVDVYEDLVS